MGKKNKNKEEKPKVVLSAFQIKERRARTCFVGNVPLEMTQKQLKAEFSKCGKVQSVWFRSVPTQLDSKIPQRAKVILKEYSSQKDNKNAYVLFERKDEAVNAVKTLNQALVQGKHIRVDLDQPLATTNSTDPLTAPLSTPSTDTNTTIFIGNLPFSVNEEDLRKHFTGLKMTDATNHLNVAGDGILNVRVVRDKQSHVGKGIAYIMFSSKALMKLAMEQKNGREFMGRPLRIKKAVSANRLEKKQIKREANQRAEIAQEKAKERAAQAAKSEWDDLQKLADMHNNIVSDDSDDEGDRRGGSGGINHKSKVIGKKKDADADEFRAHIRKIAQKSAQARSIENDGLDITPRVAFNKKKSQKVMKEMIETGGYSRYQDIKSHETKPPEVRFRDKLRAKIDKKRKHNLAKINMIKVKRIVDK